MGDLRERAREQSENLRRGLARAEDAIVKAAAPLTTTAPDVNQSDVTADPDAPVHVAWSKVMADVQWIDKNRKTTEGARYNYRGIDDVKNVVSPILRKHGVIVMPVKVEPAFEVIRTSAGKAMNFCRATVSYVVIGPRGDQLPVATTVGEAFDSGDKAATKAQSVAERIFYVTALSIPTNRPELDTEYGPQHELAAPAPPTTAEYYGMITNPRVTLTRLVQIRTELNDHPDQRDEIVTEPDGTQTKLIDVLTRVGKAKQAQQEATK